MVTESTVVAFGTSPIVGVALNVTLNVFTLEFNSLGLRRFYVPDLVRTQVADEGSRATGKRNSENAA